jgi:hypothetical protein
MRLMELINEGGWDSTATQGTVITPSVTKLGLAAMQKFIVGFNQYLQQKGINPVSLGTPTGSSAYHDVDSEETVYGDIDLQVIVPELEELAGKTHATIQSYWYKLEGDYVSTTNTGIHPDSQPGHPILPVGNDKFVQVDMMIHPEPLAKWGSARTIPERGVKGLLHGNMFSVLGELLTMSIQHSGVQFKVRDGTKQPYSSTRSNYELGTISTDPETFVMDIFNHEVQELGVQNPKVDPLLQAHPGKNIKDVKVANLVNAIKGLANSFEINSMYGHGDLKNYSNASDFINKFWQVYEGKALKDINAAKRDKAETPEAKARAEADRQKVSKGLEMVKGLFAS